MDKNKMRDIANEFGTNLQKLMQPVDKTLHFGEGDGEEKPQDDANLSAKKMGEDEDDKKKNFAQFATFFSECGYENRLKNLEETQKSMSDTITKMSESVEAAVKSKMSEKTEESENDSNDSKDK